MSPKTTRPSLSRPIREADALVRQVADYARLLPALTVQNVAGERERMIQALERRECVVPRWNFQRRKVARPLWKALDAARNYVLGTPVEQLYLARVNELELELAMIESLGQARLIRPIAARRFGTGTRLLPTDAGVVTAKQMARRILSTVPHEDELREVPAIAPQGQYSAAALMRKVASRAGLEILVKVEPKLSAGAATGDRTVFLADRKFGRREAFRFAVHEVLGHVVAAANSRDQPLRIYEVGTAGSFESQEGLALWLEEQAGVLDAYRLRILAARVEATDAMHEGVPFGECARYLKEDLGFQTADAISLSERAYRGGGVARDVGYLWGWMQVRRAIANGDVSADHLRAGRLGLDAAMDLSRLHALGFARLPRYCPNLDLSRFATESGTSCDTSPPSFAASFTMFEET